MHIISLGQSCFTKMWIDEIFGVNETHIFDWSITTPDIILDCLLTNFKNYYLINKTDSKYTHIESIFEENDKIKSYKNIYGNYFIHYTDKSENELICMLKRRSERFMNLLKSNQEILFIYCNYSYVWSSTNNNWKIIDDKQDEYYKILEKCVVFMNNINPNIKIFSINTKKYITNISNLYNITIISNSIDPNEIKTLFRDKLLGLKENIISNNFM